MYRFFVVAGIAVVLSASGALGLVRGPAAPDAAVVTGAGPVAAGQVGSPAAGRPGDIAAQVRALQERLRRVPQDGTGWAGLALAYVEQARVNGNPAFHAQAQQAAARSLEVMPDDNAAAHAAEAALSAARHHFADALAQSERALGIDPFQPNALAVRVDALTELGRYDAQLAALRTADGRQPGLPVATRYAYALELRGDLAGASAILRRAASSAAASDRAYPLALLADLDRRRGLLDRSGTHLRQALRDSPGYLPARVAAARLAVARGQLDRAAAEWEGVVATLPLPEYLTELGELYDHLGRTDAAQQQYDVVAATTRLFASSGVNTDLEVALFEADHGDPQAAVASARAEWSRRHSIHTADVLAWTLHRAGRDGEALGLARAATRLGTAEARLWLHRGAIEAGVGLDRAARTHLRRGLRVDPGTSPWQTDQAAALLAELRSRR